MGPGAFVDAVVKIEIPSSRRESNPRTPIVQPAASSVYQPRTKYMSIEGPWRVSMAIEERNV